MSVILSTGNKVNCSPSTFSQLENDHIDVWTVSTVQLNALNTERLASLITEEELQKIAQFKHASAKRTALLSRAMCRVVLSQYLNNSAQTHQFIRNKHGKPSLLDNQHQLQFNVSHNENLIIMAVCVNDAIGCDIEDPTRRVNISPITRRYFSTQEHIMLQAKKGNEQIQAFFKTWTLKEAFVKATGVGINLGLNSFYFSYDELNEINSNQVKVYFNKHYPLNTEQPWYCFHDQLHQHAFSLCRATDIPQKICYLDASHLLTTK